MGGLNSKGHSLKCFDVWGILKISDKKRDVTRFLKHDYSNIFFLENLAEKVGKVEHLPQPVTVWESKVHIWMRSTYTFTCISGLYLTPSKA